MSFCRDCADYGCSICPHDSVPCDQSKMLCPTCGGEGVEHTGIDESPTTVCRKCDGHGVVAAMREVRP